MRVNSVLTSFFTNRLVVSFGIVITLSLYSSRVSASGRHCAASDHSPLAHAKTSTPLGLIISPTIALTLPLTTETLLNHSGNESRAKQLNIIIREIGHRLLLQAGDSTSRVMPVTENTEGTFVLQFEATFDFSHDSLMMLTQGLLPKTEFPSGYTVTVHDCATTDIVYGFQFNNNSPDLLPCRGRSEAPGCYIIEFTFPDFYENVEEEQADIDQPVEEIKSFKVVPPKANPKVEELQPTTVESGIDQATEELKSDKVVHQELYPTLEEFKAKVKTSNYPLINLVYGGILLLVVSLLIGRFGKKSIPVSLPDQDRTIIKEIVPEFPSLGKFLFDVKGQRLLLANEVISLTDKECKILELLNESFGQLIPREILMQKIWINEGVITSRSLDMFVSKLRKKLSGDPELRITNVHGKGYKLEMVGT